MPLNRDEAAAVVASRFAERFPDGRFAADFAHTLVQALEDVGVLDYTPAAPAQPAQPGPRPVASPAAPAAPAASPAPEQPAPAQPAPTAPASPAPQA